MKPLLRLFMLLALVGNSPACTGMRGVTSGEDEVSPLVRPPAEWDSAATFYLPEFARVEFSDGRRLRVVTTSESVASDSTFGRTPWYRIYTADTLATTLRAIVRFGGSGTAIAEYPLTLRRDGYTSVWVYRSANSPRGQIIGAFNIRSYGLPVEVAESASDSLWIYMGTRPKSCFDCPT